MKIGKVEFCIEGIKESKASEWLLRFVFGGGVSLIAGLVGEKFGPKVGGLFLGFPSILPATLTLIVHHRSRKAASEDCVGATLGGVGSICFAVTVFIATELFGFGLSLVLATFGWFATAILLWFLAEGKS